MEIICILTALNSLQLLYLTFRQDRAESLNERRYTELSRPAVSEFEQAYRTKILPNTYCQSFHTDSEHKPQGEVTNGFSEVGQSKAETVIDCTMLNAIHEA